MLIRSAFSANIKERRDCSTALFDERGRMVTQAEHIPVHLGAMPEAVAAVMAHDPSGRAVDPQRPVRRRDTPARPHDRHAHGARIRGDARASRGRRRLRAGEPAAGLAHARRGGRGHPADAARRRDASSRSSRGCAIPTSARRPPGAAGREPARRESIAELCARRGRDRVAAAMDELLAYSERVVRAAIRELPDGRFVGEDVLETRGVLPIRAAVTIAGDSIDIDFDGTAPQYDGNLNCPLAVTRSACFYVVRCLTAPDLPASGGAFVPVTVRAPEGRSSTRARRRPWPRGTPRRRAGSPTSSSTRSRRRSPCRRRARAR